jgi:hypothetical protein
MWRWGEGWSMDETTLDRADKRDYNPKFEDKEGDIFSERLECLEIAVCIFYIYFIFIFFSFQ